MGLFKRFGSAKTAAAPSMAAVRRPAFEYAVIDVETTGLDKQQDRIVEIAVVILNSAGQRTYEWTTLVNPGTSSAGATEIHGISDDMAAVAPPFDQVAGDLAYLLGGRYVVAHNSEFDSAFVEGAFFRAGMPIAPPGLRCVCTMQIADAAGLPRKLTNLCAAVGVWYEPHNALDDARATAQVFAHFLPRIDPASFTHGPTPAGAFTAVRVERTGRTMSRDQATALATPADLVARHQARFAVGAVGDDAVAVYRDLVSGRVAGERLNATSGAAIIDRAVALGLSADQCRDVHHDVVADLFDAALADNRVSKSERAQLEATATWLGVNVGDFDAFVKAARVRRKAAVAAFRGELVGKTVVMTGRGVHPTNIREALAAKCGFTVTATYRPGVHLVVLGADTTTTAAVAAAQRAGTPTMVETEFWRRLGEL